MSEIRHETVTANGVRFHVATSGTREAPLLLCLHGFPECWYSWRHLLERLAPRFHVAAPDLRGYGDTERPASGYDLATLATDVRELVKALGHERCFLAGHDWGGAIAYETATLFPGVVEKLIVMNCPHPRLLGRAMLTNPRQIRRFWYFLLFQLPRVPEAYLARQGGRAIAGAFKAYAGRPERITKEDRDYFRKEMMKPGALEGALAYYRAATRSLLSPRALLRRERKIASPTLLLWGEKDPALGVELTHGLESYVAAPLTIRYLPDVGHWTQQEAPDEVCRAIERFVDDPA